MPVPVRTYERFRADRPVGLGAAPSAVPPRGLTAGMRAEALARTTHDPVHRERAGSLGALIHAVDGVTPGRDGARAARGPGPVRAGRAAASRYAPGAPRSAGLRMPSSCRTSSSTTSSRVASTHPALQSWSRPLTLPMKAVAASR